MTLRSSGESVGLQKRWGLPAWVRIPQMSFFGGCLFLVDSWLALVGDWLAVIGSWLVSAFLLVSSWMAVVVDRARELGVQIIHAPSDLMSVYKETPYRKRMQEAPYVKTPPPLDLPDPPLPLDASDGGCAEDDQFYWAWTAQHPAIRITGDDGITEEGQEVYNFINQRGIKYLIIMGVHTNMCMLARSFGIRQMTRWGIPVVLVRDLTDPNYNPAMPPFVDHQSAIDLMVDYIEKYWCPSIDSRDLLEVV